MESEGTRKVKVYERGEIKLIGSPDPKIDAHAFVYSKHKNKWSECKIIEIDDPEVHVHFHLHKKGASKWVVMAEEVTGIYDLEEVRRAHNKFETSDSIEPKEIERAVTTFQIEKKINRLFNKMDQNHTGTLTKNEVEKLAREMGDKLKTMMGHKKLDKAFSEMDPNGDGEVTLTEFTEWYHRNHPTEAKHVHALLLQLFKDIDVENKGKLKIEDVEKLLKIVSNKLTGKYKLEKVKSIVATFEEMDANGSGDIMYEEFVLWVCKHLNIDAPEYVKLFEERQKELMRGKEEKTYRIELKIKHQYRGVYKTISQNFHV
eukprot:g1502.t1